MARDGAINEGMVFLKYFRDLPDPRQAGKVVYPLDEIVLLCLLAVLAGGGVAEPVRAAFGRYAQGLGAPGAGAARSGGSAPPPGQTREAAGGCVARPGG